MSTQNQRCFNVKFRRWYNVDKLTLLKRWNAVILSTVIFSSFIRLSYLFTVICFIRLSFQVSWYKKHLFLEWTKIFNLHVRGWINIDKWTLSQSEYHVVQHSHVVSVYSIFNIYQRWIKVECFQGLGSRTVNAKWKTSWLIGTVWHPRCNTSRWLSFLKTQPKSSKVF